MNVRKRVLWRVPAYCFAAGLIASRLIIPVFYPSTLITQPDGSMEMDFPKQLLLYGVIFAVTLFAGWLLFRRMTRRELFCSAAILVAFYLVVDLLARFFHSGPVWTVFWYTLYAREWSGFIDTFFYWTLNGFSSLFSLLAPFLFILFGTGRLTEASA